MAENRNFAALDWVTQEIDETLAHARDALESWANDPNDNSKIRFCLAHIHQVHGSLQMVEFYGAALLAEELEHLAQALCDERVQFVVEAQDALMRGILQLPVYLDRIKTQRRDQPAVLLPLLNDLRSVRGDSLLSESRLFNPDMRPAQTVTSPRIEANQNQSQYLAVQQKLQQMYQFAAAALIRGVKPNENIHYLHKVLSRQYKLTSGTLNQSLWEISLALIEALAEKGLELSAAVKLLLRQLNRQLKLLLRNGTKGLDAPCDQELLRNLLFYVAIASSRGRFVTRIREKYKLDSNLLGEDDGSDLPLGHDPEAIRSVVLALKEELRSIKLNLDDCLSSDTTLDHLKETLPVAQRVADTLAILGVGDIRKQMLAQVDALEGIINTGQYTDQQLFDIASDLIDIEGRLDALTRGVTMARNDLEQQKALQINIAQEVVLAESRNGLEQTKDCIIEYIASQWDRRHLINVPKLLREIRGGLDMVPLPRAGAVLGACAQYIDEQLLQEGMVPEWRSLDTLADAIASIEYYLEHLSGKEHQSNDEMLLAVAEDSVRNLGLNIEPSTAAQESANSGANESAAGEPSELSAPELTLVSSDTDNETAASTEIDEPAPVAEAEAELSWPDATEDGNSLAAEEEPFDFDTIPGEEPEAEIEAASLAPAANLEASEPTDISAPEAEPVKPETANEEEDLIDDEILEIFIEEAQEVSATIDEYYPRWVENLQDGEALTEFRRAFHTLKGSGRMVGANDIGELAWTIENMLNRVIDKTIDPSHLQVELINRVLQLLPSLISAFEHRQPNPQPALCRQYMTWADEIASGVEPEALAIPQEQLPTAELAVDEVASTEEDEESQLVLWEIFSGEASGHLATIGEFIDEMDRCAPIYSTPSDPMQRALHTLKGSAHMADVQPIAQLATPLEHFIKELRTYQIMLDDDMLQLIKDGVLYINQVLDQIAAQEPLSIPRLDQYLARISELRERTIVPILRQQDEEEGKNRPVDPALLSIFMAEEMNLLLDADILIDEWRQSEASIPQMQEILQEVQLLKKGATHANHPEMAQLSALLEQLYVATLDGRLNTSERLFNVLQRSHESLLDMVDSVAAGQNLPSLSMQLRADIELLLDTCADQTEPETTALESGDIASTASELEVEPEWLSVSTDNTGTESSFSFDEEPANLAEAPPAGEDYVLLVDDNDQPADADFLSAFNNTPEIPAADSADDEVFPFDSSSFFDSVPEENPVEESTAEETTLEDGELEFSINDLSVSDGDLKTSDSDLSASDEEWHPDQNEELSAEFSFDSDFAAAGYQTSFDSPSQEEAEATEASAAESDASLASEFENFDFDAFAGNNDEILVDEPLYDKASIDTPLIEETANESLQGETLFDETLSEEPSIEETLLEEPLIGDLDDWPALDMASDTSADDGSQASSEWLTDEGKLTSELAAAESVAEATIPESLAPESQAPEPTRSAPTAGDPPSIQPSSPATTVFGADDSDEDEDEIDPEIVEIFTEEASELLEEIDVAVHDWSNEWERSDCLEQLKRSLHTFKGSARLAGILGLGEAAHDFESFLIKEGHGELGEAFFNKVNSYYELLFMGSECVQKFLQGERVPQLQALMTAGGLTLANNPFGQPGSNTSPAPSNAAKPAAPTPATEAPAAKRTEEPAASTEPSPEAEFIPARPDDEGAAGSDNVVPFAPRKTLQEAPLHPLTPIKRPERVGGPPVQSMMGAQLAQRGAQAESVKVSADLLEELVNLAGETSISRARMEEQVNEIGHTIDEMDFTIERLQEQLRRLDIETEAQVLFRQEQIGTHEDFDPLEMDRYSQLQQLSRSLMESASDLLDLKATLSDKARDTETLLLQQSRINTELQEGLMRSRMVPFSRLIPRLRRIVRQVSAELGKRVNLELDNVEGELDRTMLERMVAPLEHMVRNAIDHGIEMPDVRTANGKAETGVIRLGLAREGGDVILHLSDDGKGIDIERVKQTAIKRGLMSPEAQLSDHDIMQFILTAGFSTAQAVTQISGRGVGMDVVHSEIKQMGGSVSIDSVTGRGSEFAMRLPFTLSVNRALMVAMGEDLYAVPLNTIEGIVRVSPYELEHYYATPDARFEYAGQQYQVKYLGSLLDESYRPQLDGHALPLPVLLVRSKEYSVALQVDSLLGSREIVVKSLGPQFSAVDGLSGATVMGDGSVVVILDLLALVRRLVAQSFAIGSLPLEPAPEMPEEDKIRTVMIVDDSVTVRKVTTRFLEREGFNVVTAKDGIDALRQLQEVVPDVMLLDIEMPRMDGFEVAKNVRSSSHLRDLPIIMITSRTGSKHRERAYELGVNNYLGKPYQEDELLASINALTNTAKSLA
ncbi:Hpt domain-containing protein [Halioxenophilus sp. WMMB6]|uniref:Hpt domain-containing protein n=1 Tax=Halioxenophilus sp. WMMB6 TaxID=3073815 RepID=UPI00295EA2D9|nr:Hpt domain-containing protein [Halioxenophilus sp. WMMB6]